MSVGPEATLALLIGSSIAQQEHLKHSDDYEIDPLAWACLMTFFVGIFTLLLGIFRLGFLDSLMSRALLRGFISGVALVVMVQQGITLLGLVERSKEWGISEASTTIERLYFLFMNIKYAHGLSSTVSIISVGILLTMRIVKSKYGQSKKWFQLFPDVLLVVVGSILLTHHFDWEHKGLAILGKIESAGIPLPSIPSFPPSKHMKDLLVTSAMISVIGFVESIVIAKIYSSRHNYSVSANRELVALGVANICSGLFQGIPAFGSVSIISNPFVQWVYSKCNPIVRYLEARLTTRLVLVLKWPVWLLESSHFWLFCFCCPTFIICLKLYFRLLFL